MTSFVSVSSVQYTFSVPAPSFCKAEPEFEQSLQKTVTVQPKSTPKVGLQNGSLIIGGKTSAFSGELGGLISATEVRAVNLSCKLDKAASQKLWGVLLANRESSLATCLATITYEQIGRLTQSPILEHMRTELAKGFAVGTVTVAAKGSTKAASKSGQYVLRSLSGVLNKLTTAESCFETQSLIIKWISTLKSAVSENKIEGGDDFLKTFVSALGGSAIATKPTT
jgi:hypothetical protein